MRLKLLNFSRIGGLEVAVLFFEAPIALRLLIAQISRRRGIGHEQELHRRAVTVRESKEGGVCRKIEPSRSMNLAGRDAGGGSQIHHEAKRLTEALIVVIAGDGDNGPTAKEELLEDALQMFDG